MAGYIYLPIPTSEMRGFAKELNDGREEKGKGRYRVVFNPHVSGPLKGLRRRVGLGCLGNVLVGKLYVIVHGAPRGSRFVGATRGNVMKKYSPDQLAEVIESEGLTKSFVDLRLFACGSGLAPPGYAPFGQRLADSLRERGYEEIRVSGYLGALYSGYGTRQQGVGDFTAQKHKGVVTQRGTVERASHHKRVF